MANFQARLQPPGSIQSTAHEVSVFLIRAGVRRWCRHVPAVSPGRAGQEAEAGREAGFVRTGALRPLVWFDVSPEQWLGVQVSNWHRVALCCLLTGLSTHGAWPRSARGGIVRGQLGSRTGWGLSSQPTQPGRQKTAAAQSRGHLSSQVVLEDTVLNQRHSYP